MYGLVRQGVTLRLVDVGKGAPLLLLVHGVGCDHASFALQIEHFRRNHRVVAVDLRGHGQSDKPEQEYTVSGFADDVAWLCFELELYAPVVVGWGLGGLIGLELASRHCASPAAIVLLDSPVPPPPDVMENALHRDGTAATGPSVFYVDSGSADASLSGSASTLGGDA